jgi:hypothetical protein
VADERASDTTTADPETNGQGLTSSVKRRMVANELGVSGLKRTGGLVHEEFLPKLQGRKAAETYREMSSNDPVVGSVLFAVEMLLREVTWHVEPASESTADTEAAEFVEQCMEDMSHTWADFISEVLTMLPFGWSWFEVVYKMRSGPDQKDPKKRSKHTDNRIGWRKFAPRAQDTLLKWEFGDDGGIDGMWQLAPPDYKTVYMPIDRSLLFRTTSNKNNPEGRSILRTAYRPWYYKRRLEEVEAVGMERDLTGMPIAYVPPELLAQDRSPEAEAAYETIKSIVQKTKRDEQEGIIFPLAYDPEGHRLFEFELLASSGKRQVDISGSIDRYSTNIAMASLADFILLGHEQVGSFALSSDKTNLFAVALGAWLDNIADVLNRVAIPRLFDVNGFDVEGYPTVVPGDIETPNLGEVAQYIQQLSGAGMPLFPDEVLEQHLREIADLPDRPDDLEEKQLEAQQAQMELQNNMMAQQGPQPEAPSDGIGPALAAFRSRRQSDTQPARPKPGGFGAGEQRPERFRKHPGPDGSDTHSTGTGQEAHGGHGTGEQLQEHLGAMEAEEDMVTEGGFSIHWPSGQKADIGESGFMAAESGHEEVTRNPTTEWVHRFMRRHRPVLADPDTYLGGWKEVLPDGRAIYYLDVSRRFDDRDEALTFGAEHDQKAIFDLSTGTEIRVAKAAVGADRQRIYVPLDAHMTADEIVEALLAAGTDEAGAEVAKFMRRHRDALDRPDTVLIAKVDDETGEVQLQVAPNTKPAVDGTLHRPGRNTAPTDKLEPDWNAQPGILMRVDEDTGDDEDDYMSTLQTELARLRGQGDLVDQVSTMLRTLDAERAEAVTGEYRQALTEAVAELRDLLAEMESFQPKATEPTRDTKGKPSAKKPAAAKQKA